MKKLMLLAFVFFAAVGLAEETSRKIYKNYYSKRVKKPTRYYPRGSVIINSDSYSFKLVRKLSNTTGIFTPVCFSYRAATYGGSTRHTSEEKTIIITGLDLTHKVDDDSIKLKDKECLWSIGTHRRPNGRTYRVFSFDKNAKLPPELQSGRTVPCPHCNGTGKILVQESR